MRSGSAKPGRASSAFLRALADVLYQRGIPSPAALTDHLRNLDEGRDGGGWMSLDELARTFEQAIRLAADPALGLSWGALAVEPSFGVVGTLVANTPTVRHAIQVVQQFHPLFIEGAAVECVEHETRAQLRFDLPRTDSVLDRALREHAAAGLFRMMRAFAVEPEAVLSVNFSYARPSYGDAYTAMFGGRERFEQQHTSIELARSVIDRPNPHHQPELFGMLRGQAERTLDRLARGYTFVERVEMALRRQPLGVAPDMRPVARELAMSVRSLRRRLEEEGTSYRAVTQSALEAAARSMLRHPNWTVQATSHALGFSHVTTFHRAFKRWTGLTPKEYRDRALSGHPEPS